MQYQRRLVSELSLGNLALKVTYHLSPIDAASGINVQNKFPFSNSTSSKVYARVESLNGCYRIVQVDLIVSVTSFPANYMRELIECDDDDLNDGLHVFDLSQTTSEILALFLPAQSLRVSFYRNLDDALSETAKIDPEYAYFSENPYSQTIWVRVESSVNGGCFGIFFHGPDPVHTAFDGLATHNTASAAKIEPGGVLQL